MASKKKEVKKVITQGVLVTVQGRVRTPDGSMSDDFYDETAKVLSISPDGNSIEIKVEKSEYDHKKRAYTTKTVEGTTWIGNVDYYSEAPKYDKGDLVSLVPVKVVDYEIYGDDEITYTVMVGEQEIEIPGNAIAQVLLKE